MKKNTKLITMIASWMIVIGILLAVIGVMAGAKFGITNTKSGFKVIGLEDQMKEEFALQSFTKMNINLNDVDIEIIPSNEYKLTITKDKDKEIEHKVVDDTLVIEEFDQKDSPKSFLNLTFTSIPHNIIKIYIPKDVKFSDIMLGNKFGDVRLRGINSENISLDSNSGDLTLNTVQTTNLKIANKFGDLNGSNVTTKELLIETNSGDTVFDTLHAESTGLENHFGNLTFRNFTSEELNIKSNSGDIDIRGLLLGTSTIHTKYGDVVVKLQNKESEIGYNIQNDFGDITVNNKDYEKQATHTVNTNNMLNIISSNGDVEVSF